MFIKMHNVGFGDCFILTNKHHHLIVDCGTRNYRDNRRSPSSFKNFVDQCILQEISNNPAHEYSALITHFHQDHYSGFKHMSKKYTNIFSCLYVPFLLVKDSVNDNYFLLDQIICSYLIYAMSSKYYTLANDALKHIRNLAPLAKNNNIRPLCFRQNFCIYNKRFDVLWPDPIYTYLTAINNEYSYNIIEITHDALQAIDRSSAIENTTEKILRIKNELIDLFSNWYTSYNHDDFKTTKISELINRMDNPLEELLKIKKSIDQEKIGNFRLHSKLGKSLIVSENSTSIVFHDRDTQILMTGDITTNIIDNVLVNRFNNHYNYLKVPHHGTHGHYSQNLPFACNFLISNGYHARYNSISSCYINHGCPTAFRWCTARRKHCKIFSNGNTCLNNSCQNNSVTLPF